MSTPRNSHISPKKRPTVEVPCIAHYSWFSVVFTSRWLLMFQTLFYWFSPKFELFAHNLRMSISILPVLKCTFIFTLLTTLALYKVKNVQTSKLIVGILQTDAFTSWLQHYTVGSCSVFSDKTKPTWIYWGCHGQKIWPDISCHFGVKHEGWERYLCLLKPGLVPAIELTSEALCGVLHELRASHYVHVVHGCCIILGIHDKASLH